MKLYQDTENNETIAINDEGYAFPVSRNLVAMGRSMAGDAWYKTTVETAIADYLSGEAPNLIIGQLGGTPFKLDSNHKYAGKTVEEVIENLGKPEVI
ncbi:hypothetical protein CHOED_047 [Vibrio phage CHOED]|uniref:hypothetical protein n=1 Tax=Vibrio phage CHOED TaxID=1458716 RepID=UPI00042EB30F|nr:hypothetical protein CHOED_047 [Vibrio phage CHOED]AHK11907.1 hypothetical protein CHOED_047 [Vibrio phage CHOED]